jgi:N-glycosylase/DNA lyase
LNDVLVTFPEDEPMRAAVAACRGLRLLRQDPWECLASFILSSTKQIVQIQQIVALLCERFGEPIATPPGHPTVFAFPSAERLARVSEADLRACKMGFRAPIYGPAMAIAGGQFNPAKLSQLLRTAPGGIDGFARRWRRYRLRNCCFAGAFLRRSGDVWVMKAAQRFPRRVKAARLSDYRSHFGPHTGYAQLPFSLYDDAVES